MTNNFLPFPTVFKVKFVEETDLGAFVDFVCGDFHWGMLFYFELTKSEKKALIEILERFKFLPTLNTHRQSFIGNDSLRDKLIAKGLVKDSKVRGKYLFPRSGIEVCRNFYDKELWSKMLKQKNFFSAITGDAEVFAL